MNREQMRRASLNELYKVIYALDSDLAGRLPADCCDLAMLLTEAGQLRGGEHKLYKPGLALSWYEHDDEARVYVHPCKGCPCEEAQIANVCLVTPTAGGTAPLQKAVLMAILLMLQSGAR